MQRVHIIGCISTDISKDGKTAMLVFSIAGEKRPKEFAITCAVEHLPLMRLIFHEAMARVPPPPVEPNKQMLALKSVGAGGTEEIGVAGSYDSPLPIIIRMCPDRSEELSFGVSIETALKLPQVIHEVVDKMKSTRN